ncbi:flippase-like domain-containing protein [Phaeocystidibacter marisrubri]|uniref:Flippase-like domain-containing protein n=1 Tax=Phaeocystidibacter marisrubri TaxID=1577780 RepID=A0A6L3ZFH4_9FLAO|nr:flippase-like domain-containing protein [Phaeocystidibacter marisrubri]
MEPLNPLTKNILKYTLFAVIAAALLGLAFKNVDPQELWTDLKQAHYGYVLASMIIGYAAIVSRGLRWKLLLEPLGYHPKSWNSIHSVSTLYFVNLALPRAGELARCTSLNQVEDIPVNKLFGTVLLERTIDMVFLILVFGGAVVVNFDYIEQLFNITASGSGEEGGSSYILYILLGLVAAAVLLFFAFRERIQASPLFVKVRDFYEGLKEGFKAVFKMKRQAAFWFHSVFIWLCYFFMVYICFFAIDETAHLTIADGLFIMVAASLGIVIPVPGGIGAYHYLVMSAMVVLGFTSEVGLTFATIVHSGQTLMLLGTGALAMFILYLERRLKKKA